MPVYLCLCVCLFCVSHGMTVCDCKRSIIVNHILLEMPMRQFEDKCRPLNVYKTSLTTHFVYEQQNTEIDPNVNELWLDLLPQVLDDSMWEGHTKKIYVPDFKALLWHLWPEFVFNYRCMWSGAWNIWEMYSGCFKIIDISMCNQSILVVNGS